MKTWCYVETNDGREGYVEVDTERPIRDQISDQVRVYGINTCQAVKVDSDRDTRQGSYLVPILGWGLIAILVVTLCVMLAGVGGL